jgi:hypothetical protein
MDLTSLQLAAFVEFTDVELTQQLKAEQPKHHIR